ncbi:hypothetical protein [Allosphingosinicella vermicomposti]|uniref:hypothetical protein n=1 Tax=Allosphingosinicella vermicomposti TaxID=614671 RepID=UPI000D113136|nr:hypothetical protein [Allosphingosinicella vermicomposti]
MARSKEQLIGRLHGETSGGDPMMVRIYKTGRSYRLSGARDHLCHPSVKDIEGVKREALLVFHLKNGVFEPS